jgi:serine/threonine-protein kinase
VVVAAPTDVSVADASGDGKWLLYEESMRDNPQYSTLKALPLAAEAKAFVVLERIDSSSNARLMPGLNDWVAFQASDSGRSEVYVTRFPNAGAKYQVSFAGGTQPVWSRDGKRLYYLDVGQRLTAVDIKTDKDSIEFGTPKTLFQTSVRTSITSEGYDVTADGRFLLMNMITENPTPLTLIVNWDTEIRK